MSTTDTSTILSHGDSFINTVTYLPTSIAKPMSDYPNGLVISGGKDTIVEVRSPNSTPTDNAEAMLLGHSSNVCALDVDGAGQFIVSGSWDGTARIWTVGKWQCESTLEGHEGSVWAVLAYDADTIITGCADKIIRVFSRNGSLRYVVEGSTDVVRALCRTPGHPSGSAFASAGNDGVIRLWTIRGQQVGELVGHESFIYSLDYLNTKEIVSAGEDRTVRIWKETRCVQTITHPAISVWSVAVCSRNGDIVTGASDKIARVFTRDADRAASPQEVAAFDESVRMSAIPQQQMGEKINKETLPGPEFLQQKQGTKDGQTQMIREADGSITAHQWSSGQGAWECVGTVVDSVGSSGKKVPYNGQDYDYVFDVDIEDGKPPLKLPYNLSSNPYEAATKFITTNELPVTYLEQVANFIVTNTQGASLGPQSQSTSNAEGPDPWGSENRYRPGGANEQPPPSTRPKILPQKEYLSIMVASVDKMQKKIEELNQKIIADGRKDISLNPTELSVLQDVRKLLESDRATQKSKPVEGGLELAVKLVTSWPYSDRLPGLDLVRLLAAAPSTATFGHPRAGNIVDLLISSVEEGQPPAENNIMMAIRAFVNLFETSEGQSLAITEFDKIQAFTSAPLLRGTKNRNLLVAAVTLYINYAVLMTSSSNQTSESFEQALAMLEVLSGLVAKETDSEVVYRGMVALGTFLGLDQETKTAAKEVYDVEKAVTTAAGKASDPRIKNLALEVKAVLK